MDVRQSAHAPAAPGVAYGEIVPSRRRADDTHCGPPSGFVPNYTRSDAVGSVGASAMGTANDAALPMAMPGMPDSHGSGPKL